MPLLHFSFLPEVGPCRISDLRELIPLAKQRRKNRRFRKHDVLDLLQRERKLPCLFFCFSRRECEARARANQRRGLLGDADTQRVIGHFDELGTALPGHRPARVLRAPAARRRAASLFHHAGMLPIYKEIVERLFTSGLHQAPLHHRDVRARRQHAGEGRRLLEPAQVRRRRVRLSPDAATTTRWPGAPAARASTPKGPSTRSSTATTTRRRTSSASSSARSSPSSASSTSRTRPRSRSTEGWGRRSTAPWIAPSPPSSAAGRPRPSTRRCGSGSTCSRSAATSRATLSRPKGRFAAEDQRLRDPHRGALLVRRVREPRTRGDGDRRRRDRFRGAARRPARAVRVGEGDPDQEQGDEADGGVRESRARLRSPRQPEAPRLRARRRGAGLDARLPLRGPAQLHLHPGWRHRPQPPSRGAGAPPVRVGRSRASGAARAAPEHARASQPGRGRRRASVDARQASHGVPVSTRRAHRGKTLHAVA